MTGNIMRGENRCEDMAIVQAEQGRQKTACAEPTYSEKAYQERCPAVKKLKKIQRAELSVV